MTTDQHIWRLWAEKLHRWGLGEMAASMMEAAGPVMLLGAQVIYLSQPFLGKSLPQGHLAAAARLLEEPERVRSFAAMLREDARP
ncbi:MAG: hypothetical protein L0Z70_08975 [Chloroflexi bacterium]|nr:hypothetical protein [Chloroflexota bacterium]